MKFGHVLLLPAITLACGSEPEVNGDAYAPETLEAHRRAIPSSERALSAVAPSDEQPFAIVAPASAVLAPQAVAFARDVNLPARRLIATLRALVALPPSSFDAEGRTFTWGPWDNENGVGQVLLAITENPASADFAYSYSLLRAIDSDFADASPVIVGGATPEPDDRGVGVALWDLEQNRTFDREHDPEHVEADAAQGRFVMLFGTQTSPDHEALFNVALFRHFLPEARDRDGLDGEPVNVDYFYGRLRDADNTIDFLDSEVFADLCDGAPESCFDRDTVADADERFGFNAFFVNGGVGRAEARISEGDLAGPIDVIECWNPGMHQSSFQIGSEGQMVETVNNGSCAAPADQPALELGLPTLGDIDPALLEALSCAAENGLIGCE